MRRRVAVALYAGALVAQAGLFGLLLVGRSDVLNALVVAGATALGCGALSLRLLRPMLRRSRRPSHDALAAALLASASLATLGPLVMLAASPTVALALTPPRLPVTIGSLVGVAVALPALVGAWRDVDESEWRALALAALALGVLLSPGGDMWFPALGVVGVQAAAFIACVDLALQRDALILPP